MPGQITIATNMAGRGTDIILGGNPKGLAQMALEYMVPPCAAQRCAILPHAVSLQVCPWWHVTVA